MKCKTTLAFALFSLAYSFLESTNTYSISVHSSYTFCTPINLTCRTLCHYSSFRFLSSFYYFSIIKGSARLWKRMSNESEWVKERNLHFTPKMKVIWTEPLTLSFISFFLFLFFAMLVHSVPICNISRFISIRVLTFLFCPRKKKCRNSVHNLDNFLCAFCGR